LVAVALVSCRQASIADLQVGDQIVAAVEKYRADHGQYPETLSQLAPTYLPSVTPPRYGSRKWDYVTYRDRSDFALFYWGSRPYQDGYAYGAPEKKWEIVHNSF
jgi:hypothetical protein